MRSGLRVLVVYLAGCCAAACDDPLDGPTGALLLVVRTVEASPESRFAGVEELRFEYDRLVVKHVDESGTARDVELDAATRSFTLPAKSDDVVISRVPAPTGAIEQIRLFATRVVVRTTDGTETEILPDTPDLPSWGNTGWKVIPDDDEPQAGEPFVIAHDRTTGVRAFFDFGDRLVARGPAARDEPRWKVKPTVEATSFDPIRRTRSTACPSTSRVRSRIG